MKIAPGISFVMSRIKIRREIKQSLIEDGYSQEEIANEQNNLVDKQIQRIVKDNSKKLKGKDKLKSKDN